MTPLDKMRHDLADHIYNLLDANFPRYRILNEPELAKQLQKALTVGIVRWSMVCGENNKSKAAIRCGLNRNTILKVINEGLVMREELKYEKAMNLHKVNEPRQSGAPY